MCVVVVVGGHCELLFLTLCLLCVLLYMLCLLLHQVQLQKLSMEQEISLVEMTEQIIGKKQNFTRCGLGRTCAFYLSVV